MKKKLEAELMSIAHKILKLKNKSDIEVLHRETQTLYEKLSVLKFVEENFSQTQPTIGRKEVEQTIETVFEKEEDQDLEHENTLDTASENVAFAERTQQEDLPIIKEENSEEIAVDTSSDEETIAENDESSEEEIIVKVEEDQVEAETKEDKDSEQDLEQLESENQEVEESSTTEVEEIEEEESEVLFENNSSEEIDLEENNNSEEADLEEEEEEEEEIAVSESTQLDEEQEEMPAAFSAEGDSQVRNLEIGTAEAIANDQFLEDKAEEKEDDSANDLFKPSFDWDFATREGEKAAEEEKMEEVKKPVETQARQFTFDDLLGVSYKDPEFVKPEDLELERLQNQEAAFEQKITKKEEPKEFFAPKVAETPRATSLNDKFSKGIIVGLNDRIAFVKHLFANSNEDYNRVLSQMMTFNSLEEAQEFIDQMVKPDYHNWTGKEDYEERFMEVIAKKFS